MCRFLCGYFSIYNTGNDIFMLNVCKKKKIAVIWNSPHLTIKHIFEILQITNVVLCNKRNHGTWRIEIKPPGIKDVFALVILFDRNWIFNEHVREKHVFPNLVLAFCFYQYNLEYKNWRVFTVEWQLISECFTKSCYTTGTPSNSWWGVEDSMAQPRHALLQVLQVNNMFGIACIKASCQKKSEIEWSSLQTNTVWSTIV